MTTQNDLATFASTAMCYARSSDVVLFGDRKAFICTVLEAWFMDSPATCPRRAEFGPLLFAAHQAGLLVLTRADLVGAMDQELVEWSEVKVPGATFHFIITK